GGSSSSGNSIRPLVAGITIQDTSSTQRAVYFEKVSTSGDLVTVNLMLRTNMTETINGFAFTLLFDNTVFQVGGADTSMTPFGACASTAGACTVECLTNASTANATGELNIGVTLLGSPCTGFTTDTSTPEPLFTLGFIAAAEGTSTLRFGMSGSTGDCQVFDAGGNDLGIPCLDGAATLTATQ
ncbi:MAG TPA: hypothetical protein VNL37_00700, partial [Candidatus Polarisedimenticolia bacterium]|nr:hypothetical protein [Candidatus Polarisedimenticolia bacterium]